MNQTAKFDLAPVRPPMMTMAIAAVVGLDEATQQIQEAPILSE
jgi:hypothetical protein